MRVLLTGATGFVGRALYPALIGSGCEVICTSRNPARARESFPDRQWCQMDIEEDASVERALSGCDVAFYLLHAIGQGDDYPQKEAQWAKRFRTKAAAAGVSRIVYLGGVQPENKASRHLRSRRVTGKLLREGMVPTVELRAAMILGEGSASWTMVKDLAARLPAMLLPRWLKNRSCPVAIDDVVWALCAAAHEARDKSVIYELPGPECITHESTLRRVAAVMDLSRPMLHVPILSPRLSSYWIALVTRVDLAMARELVEGLRQDLLPTGVSFWSERTRTPMSLETATELALADEVRVGARFRERCHKLGQDYAESVA